LSLTGLHKYTSRYFVYIIKKIEISNNDTDVVKTIQGEGVEKLVPNPITRYIIKYVKLK